MGWATGNSGFAEDGGAIRFRMGSLLEAVVRAMGDTKGGKGPVRVSVGREKRNTVVRECEKSKG